MQTSAEIHIQKTAPGPPKAMARDTPVRFPTPMVPARDVAKARKGETVLPVCWGDRIWRNMDKKPRKGKNRVLAVAYNPKIINAPADTVPNPAAICVNMIHPPGASYERQENFMC